MCHTEGGVPRDFPPKLSSNLPTTAAFLTLSYNLYYVSIHPNGTSFPLLNVAYIKTVILYETLHVDLPVADDFIDVHVALCPGASLPDDQGKVIVQLTIMNLGKITYFI